MDRNGFWARTSLSTGELISLIKVENDYEDSYWNFDTNEFVRLTKPVMDLGMSDDYDSIDEQEALELLGRVSWENDDEELSEE